jgi:NTE family protein
VKIGTHRFWDGALVSNTPLQYLLEKIGADNLLVFQVDLFSAIGPRPCDMFDVMSRQKDIQYSSRTRLVTDLYLRMHRQNVQMRKLLDKLPDDRLDEAERTLKQRLSDLPQIALLHLIYRESAYEGEARDYDFSASSMREHWDLGYRDTVRTLRHRDWLEMPGEDEGIVVHDVHRSKN